jgi:periplasmic copper chaperone A
MAFAILCGCSQHARIEVSDAWSAALPPTATVGAAYMRISSSAPDELISADTPIASRVEFHTTQNTNGMMQMRKLQRLRIPSGESLTFEPGSNHMMLVGLRQPLVAGSAYRMTLHFKNAGNISVDVPVKNGLGE